MSTYKHCGKCSSIWTVVASVLVLFCSAVCADPAQPVVSEASGFNTGLQAAAQADQFGSLLQAQVNRAVTAAQGLAEWTVGNRRKLHSIPELQYDLDKTSNYVREVLGSIGVEYRFPVAKNGIVADIGTGQAPCVALRADMDALPIEEISSVDYASTHKGKMHACGHDGHTSMLLTAARILKEQADQGLLNGTVRLLFQPAEEGGAGALSMIRDGALSQHPPVQMVHGLHVWPTLPTGTFATKVGPVMGASGFFSVKLFGKGSHAALPQEGVDPIIAATHVISMLQSIISRNVNPINSGVVSITKIHAGSAFNVIPPEVEFGGTIRAIDRASWEYIQSRVDAIVHEGAKAMGCKAETFFPSFDQECLDRQISKERPASCTYPAVVNDATSVQIARRTAAFIFGEDKLAEVERSLTGEDFSYFQEQVPGVFSFIGQGDQSLGTTWGLHHPKFTLNEKVLPYGAAQHVAFAHAAISHLQQSLS